MQRTLLPVQLGARDAAPVLPPELSAPSSLPLPLPLHPPAAAAESRTTTIYAFHTLSYISEGVIFVNFGLDALDPLKWQV